MRKNRWIKPTVTLAVILLVGVCGAVLVAAEDVANPNRDDFVPEGAQPDRPAALAMILEDDVPLVPLEELPDTGAGARGLHGLLVLAGGMGATICLLRHRISQ